MRGRFTTALAAVLAVSSASAWAHHSFAMFDTVHQIDINGTVTAFKFTSPHTLLLVKVMGPDGNDTDWALEGVSASSLFRDGWRNTSLKPGDKVKARIAPLRSGAPGGSWDSKTIFFPDGSPVVVTHQSPTIQPGGTDTGAASDVEK
jgi:hypothetical protein